MKAPWSTCLAIAKVHHGALRESVQGNCASPFLPQDQQAWGLDDRYTASLRQLKRFQCVVVADSSIFTVFKGNLWLDNIHLIISRTNVQQTTSFIEASQVASGPGSNIFLTNMTFQADGHSSVRAVSVLVNDRTYQPLTPQAHHSILVKGVQSEPTCLHV